MLGREKNFGSGQLIFENWSGGLVDVFFKKQPKFSKSNECQQVYTDADAEIATSGVRCWMSGVGSRLTPFQPWRKRGVAE